MKLQEHIKKVIDGLNRCQVAYMKSMGYTFEPDKWHAKERRKYIALDCGTSGAFLMDKATGELYNIKSYGAADQNKKRKADIGNIQTVDPAWLFTKRWNYLK